MSSRLTVVLVSLLFGAPPVIFCLWLVIVPARIAVRCPEECKCENGGILVTCYGKSLTAPPLIRLTGVRKLGLIDNNITMLEKDTFVSRGLSQLEILQIKGCGMRTIELGAFNGLTELTHISIIYNEISEIIPGTFVNMNSLKYLDLQFNSLEHLHSDIFSGLVNLKTLFLTGNNLQYLHPDTFLRLPNLQNLFFENNPGLQIPTDHNFINLHSLQFLIYQAAISVHCQLKHLQTSVHWSGLTWSTII